MYVVRISLFFKTQTLKLYFPQTLKNLKKVILGKRVRIYMLLLLLIFLVEI